VFGGNEVSQARPLGEVLEPTRLAVEPLQGLHFLVSPKLCLLHGRLHNPNGLIVHFQGNGLGMAILSAMCQRETGRIREAVWRAMHDLGDHCERSDRSRADARR
jgi:hypothetical protein